MKVIISCCSVLEIGRNWEAELPVVDKIFAVVCEHSVSLVWEQVSVRF